MSDKVEVVTVARTKAIRRIHNRESISVLFPGFSDVRLRSFPHFRFQTLRI